MKRISCLLASAGMVCAATFAGAQTTEFNYQTQLVDGSGPISGTFDFRFTLYDAVTNGTAVSASSTNSALLISNGLLSVQLDFGGSVFNGSNRWMDVGLRTNGSTGSFTPLSPRDLLNPTPYAIWAAKAGTAGSVTGSVAASQLTGTIADARLSANVAKLNGNATFTGTVKAANFTGNGNGLTNVPGAMPWQNVAGTNINVQVKQSYLFTNDSLTTAILPTSAQVGDIITVGGSGAGGWQVYSPTQEVLGHTIPAGVKWSAIGFTMPCNFFNSVACSGDGTRLVMTVTNDLSSGCTNSIWISADAGTTWTNYDNTNQWSGIASSASGSNLVAVAYNDFIYTSTNAGQTWTARDAKRFWTAVACSSDGATMLATTLNPYTYEAEVYVSTNAGGAWVQRLSGGPYAIACSGNGATLVAGDASRLQISNDRGNTWVDNYPPVFQCVSVAASFDGSKLLVGGNDEAAVSSDAGANWTNVLNDLPNQWQSSACSQDGTHMIMGNQFGDVYASWDSGKTWNASGMIFNCQAVAASMDGTHLYALPSYDSHLYVSVPWPGIGSSSGYTSASLQYIGNNQWQLLGPSDMPHLNSDQTFTGKNSFGGEVSYDGAASYTGSVGYSGSASYTGSVSYSGGVSYTGSVNFGSGVSFSGPVGIGTASPSHLLELQSPGNVGLALTSTDSGGGSWTLQSTGTNGLGGAFEIIDSTGNTPFFITKQGTVVIAGALQARTIYGWEAVSGRFYGDGSYLTNLSASNIIGSFATNQIPNLDAGKITTGALADARLSANVALRNANQTFSGVNAFTNAGNSFVGSSFSGNGNGLSNVNATNANTVGGNQLVSQLSGMELNTNFIANIHPIYLKTAGDVYHGLGHIYAATNFSGLGAPDGPMLWGTAGGALGSLGGGARLGLVWTTNGVGIGITNPATELHVQSAGDCEISVQSSDAVGRRWTIQSSGGGTGGREGTFQIIDRTAVASRLMIDTNGHFGVGVAPTSDKLIHTSNGAYLSVAGNWMSVSDRNVKEDFASVDKSEILEKVIGMPITQWKYKVEADGTKHIGPMAQDFHSAFGLGDSDKAIGSVDEDGVALAAIQGLNQKLERQLKEKDAEIQKLMHEKDSQIQELQQSMAELKEMMLKMSASRAR